MYGAVSAADGPDGVIAARWDGQCCSAGGALRVHSVSAGGQECCSRLPVRRGLILALIFCHRGTPELFFRPVSNKSILEFEGAHSIPTH